MGTILIGGKRYELIVDHKNGWNPSAFRDRYSDVLERYDYIIGDWGYNQLRLKGFFRDQHPKGNKDSFISGLVDYINEYCNFGCAYFVIQRHETSEQELADMNEPDLLLTPPSTSESGAEDVVVALDENGDPIVLREHIRKPHPVRKEAPVRTDRSGQETGGGRPNKNGASPQRKDARISNDRKDADDFGFDSGGDRRGGGQPRGERRGGEQQRGGNGQSRGSDRSGGEQPRGGKPQRGGNERSGGEFRGKEQSRGQEPRGGQPRSGGQQQRGGGNGSRGEQQRSGQPRGGQENRGGQQRFDSELPGADGLPAEGRQRFKHRKGQKRLPIPPREQTVAATSEAALTQRPKPQGGDNGQS